MNRQDLHSYALRVIDAVVHLYSTCTKYLKWRAVCLSCTFSESVFRGREYLGAFFLYDWRLFVVMAS